MSKIKIFYSNARKGIESIKQEKATPIQWLNMLKNNGAFKIEEDTWLGLSDWLKATKVKSLSKKDILSFVIKNEISIKEILLNTKKNSLDDYSTVGLTNKKELIFSVPNIESWDDDFMYYEETGGKTIASARFGETIANGKRILVIDEIQSHRHQFSRMNPDAKIPSAPFEKSWYKLMMKRLLRYAAENNYDLIAWTTGNIQNERCGYGDKYKELLYSTDNNDTFLGTIILHADKKSPLFYPIKDKNQLVPIVGKKITDKIIAGKRSMNNITINNDGVIEFYDHILPLFIDKYCKKWDISTKYIDIFQKRMHSISITEAMKESVMQGQAMFRSINTNSSKTSISAIKRKEKIDKLKKTFSADIILADTRNDLPVHLIKQISTQEKYSGVFDTNNNKVYLILSELNSLEDIEKTFKHEVLGHQGLRAIYKNKLHEFLDDIFRLIPKEDKINYLKKYSNKYIATEEYIATQAENYKDPTIWDKIQFIFRNYLREWGFSTYFSNNDIRCILSKRGQIIKQSKFLSPLPCVNVRNGKTPKQEKVWIATLPINLSDQVSKKCFALAKKFQGLIEPKTRNIVFQLKKNALEFKRKVETKILNVEPPNKNKRRGI